MINSNKKIAQYILINQVPTILEDKTISDVENLLFSKIKDLKTINYIYIIDNEEKLKGVLSIKEVFRAEKK